VGTARQRKIQPVTAARPSVPEDREPGAVWHPPDPALVVVTLEEVPIFFSFE
jgi:hypothetical protein